MNADLLPDAGPAPGGLIHAVLLPRPARSRSPLTSNMDRILSDLLDDVLQGWRSVAEAATEYGTQPPGGGRRRRFATFRDYLDDRIRYATDAAVEQRLRDLLSRMARNRRLRAGDTRLVNRLLDETGRDRAGRLRELRAELTDA